ncbi:MAG: DUF445 family protein [Synergistales bacterium]|nr:DUF445 family protein [Synergistales bacterium]
MNLPLRTPRERIDWIKWVAFYLLAGCVATGLWCDYLGFSWGRLLWFIAGSASIGLLTNVLAVKMIFHRISVGVGRYRCTLPGSGVIVNNREEILDTLSREVRERLLTPEALHATLQEEALFADLYPLVRKELRFFLLRRENLRIMIRALGRPVEEYLAGEEFRRVVREKVREIMERRVLFSLADRMNLVDPDEIAQLFSEAARERWCSYVRSEEGVREAQKQLAQIMSSTTLQEDDLIPLLQDRFERVVFRLLHRIDLGETAKRSLSGFSTGKLEAYLEVLSGRYLSWIELWGGVLGALVGFALWMAQQLLGGFS